MFIFFETSLFKKLRMRPIFYGHFAFSEMFNALILSRFRLLALLDQTIRTVSWHLTQSNLKLSELERTLQAFTAFSM